MLASEVFSETDRLSKVAEAFNRRIAVANGWSTEAEEEERARERASKLERDQLRQFFDSIPEPCNLIQIYREFGVEVEACMMRTKVLYSVYLLS
jgi:hypothetical protein